MATAIFNAIEQALVVRGLIPAFIDNAVAEGALASFGPGSIGRGCVVGVVIDVANFGIAFLVWLWYGRRRSGCEGRRISVEDDLIALDNPCIIPQFNRRGLLPRGFGLAALVGAVGCNNLPT